MKRRILLFSILSALLGSSTVHAQTVVVGDLQNTYNKTGIKVDLSPKGKNSIKHDKKQVCLTYTRLLDLDGKMPFSPNILSVDTVLATDSGIVCIRITPGGYPGSVPDRYKNVVRTVYVAKEETYIWQEISRDGSVFENGYDLASLKKHSKVSDDKLMEEYKRKRGLK